ncbi:hypothetical protein F5884DRAFT_835621 [Xylogone sp. PMI_703]|nr:hypothetical protein F5884DRAFT_835621 [Xylogone sp. PMI_703]
MKFSIIFLSSIVHLALATNSAPSCHADNCARAVTGTRLGAAHVTQAMSDCRSLLAATPAPQSLPSYAGNCPNFSAYSSACSCWGATPTTSTPTPTPTCGGADLLNDPNNCGTCGNVCPSGKCVNGVCAVSECTGQVCGSFINCSPNGDLDCQCYSTSDGTGFCAGNQFCDELATCNTTSDCAADSVCVVQSCCGINVCLPAVCNNNAVKLKKMAKMVKERVPRLCSSGEC